MLGRQKVAALVAEFLGAGVLTLLVLSVQRSTIGVPFFVALAGGLTVALLTFAVGGASGGHYNPALTIALWTVRKVQTLTGLLYVGAQMLGGWAAYGLYTYLVNNTLQPIGGKFSWHILVAEAVGAAIFAFAWVSGAFQRFSQAVGSSVAGLAYMLGVVAASSAAIGLINPAVALGVRAWAWAYVVGPIVGAFVGAQLYTLVFADAKEVAAIYSMSSTSSKTAAKS